MRIGIYGGTFDPIHLAHLVLADQCRQQLQLDEVWFVPAAQPPHKQGQRVTATEHRLEMLRRALQDQPAFRLCTVELDREGVSYTVDTLSALTQQFPEHTWWLLIGADSLRDFPTWHEPERISTLARIGVVNRGGEPAPDLAAAQAAFGDRFSLAEMPSLAISATDLRQRVAAGQSIRYLVPAAVEDYIRAHQLYATNDDDTE